MGCLLALIILVAVLLFMCIIDIIVCSVIGAGVFLILPVLGIHLHPSITMNTALLIGGIVGFIITVIRVALK